MQDLNVNNCLKKHGIHAPRNLTRDETGAELFNPFNVGTHFSMQANGPKDWYRNCALDLRYPISAVPSQIYSNQTKLISAVPCQGTLTRNTNRSRLPPVHACIHQVINPRMKAASAAAYCRCRLAILATSLDSNDPSFLPHLTMDFTSQ